MAAEKVNTPVAHFSFGKAIEHQVGGSHYKEFEIQPVEFIHRNGLGFCEGNAIKYICRYRAKNGIQDLEKAKHYIDLLIEYLRESESRI